MKKIIIGDWTLEWEYRINIIKMICGENVIRMTADDAEDFARALLVAVKASRRNTSIK